MGDKAGTNSKRMLHSILQPVMIFATYSSFHILSYPPIQTGIEQNRCAMACQGCGAAFYFF